MNQTIYLARLDPEPCPDIPTMRSLAESAIHLWDLAGQILTCHDEAPVEQRTFMAASLTEPWGDC